MASKQHYDFVFVFMRLKMERAFLYSATNTPVSLVVIKYTIAYHVVFSDRTLTETDMIIYTHSSKYTHLALYASLNTRTSCTYGNERFGATVPAVWNYCFVQQCMHCGKTA